jgi:hypothetical protein
MNITFLPEGGAALKIDAAPKKHRLPPAEIRQKLCVPWGIKSQNAKIPFMSKKKLLL